MKWILRPVKTSCDADDAYTAIAGTSVPTSRFLYLEINQGKLGLLAMSEAA